MRNCLLGLRNTLCSDDEMTKKREDPGNDSVWDETPSIGKPIYSIEERPQTWWECLLFGWQHTLVDISPFVLPLASSAAALLRPWKINRNF